MNTVKRQCLAFAMLFMSGVTNPVFASASSSPSHLEGQDETNTIITPRQALENVQIPMAIWENSGNLPEDVIRDASKLMQLNLTLGLKVMAVTGQMNEELFKKAYVELAKHIETTFSMGDDETQNNGWVSLIQNIESRGLKMLLGAEPLTTDDVLRSFWSHCAGQSEVIRTFIKDINAKKESLPADSDGRLTLHNLSLVLGRKLYVANHPNQDPLNGVGSDFLLLIPSNRQDLIFERAFADKARTIPSVNLFQNYYELGVKLIDQMMVDGIEEEIVLETGDCEIVNTQAYLDYLRISCDYHTYATKFSKSKLSPDDVVNAYLEANVNLAVFHNHFPNVDAPEWFDFNTDLAKFGGLATIKKQVAIMAELVDVEAEQTELMTFFGENQNKISALKARKEEIEGIVRDHGNTMTADQKNNLNNEAEEIDRILAVVAEKKARVPDVVSRVEDLNTQLEALKAKTNQ